MNLDFYPHEWDVFYQKCGFTDEEKRILEYKKKYGKEWLNIRYAEEFKMPLRTFERRLEKIYKKIIRFI